MESKFYSVEFMDTDDTAGDYYVCDEHIMAEFARLRENDERVMITTALTPLKDRPDGGCEVCEHEAWENSDLGRKQIIAAWRADAMDDD